MKSTAKIQGLRGRASEQNERSHEQAKQPLAKGVTMTQYISHRDYDPYGKTQMFSRGKKVTEQARETV